MIALTCAHYSPRSTRRGLARVEKKNASRDDLRNSPTLASTSWAGTSSLRPHQSEREHALFYSHCPSRFDNNEILSCAHLARTLRRFHERYVTLTRRLRFAEVASFQLRLLQRAREEKDERKKRHSRVEERGLFSFLFFSFHRFIRGLSTPVRTTAVSLGEENKLDGTDKRSQENFVTGCENARGQPACRQS